MLDSENPINPKMDMQKIVTLDGFGVRADPNSYTRWFWRPRRPQEKNCKKCNLK